MFIAIMFTSVSLRITQFDKKGGEKVKKFSMYPNLEAEIARAGITNKELAEAACMSTRTLYSKLTGDTPFTIDEARLVCAYLEKRSRRAMSIKNLFNIN